MLRELALTPCSVIPRQDTYGAVERVPRELVSRSHSGWTGDQHLKKELGSLSGVMDSLISEHLFEEHFTGKLHRHRASLRAAQTLLA